MTIETDINLADEITFQISALFYLILYLDHAPLIKTACSLETLGENMQFHLRFPNLPKAVSIFSNLIKYYENL